MKQLAAILACLILSAPAFATNRTGPTNPTQTTTSSSGSSDTTQRVIGGMVLGAIGLCVGQVIYHRVTYGKWEMCGHHDTAPVIVESTVKSSIPENATDSSTLYGVEATRKQ